MTGPKDPDWGFPEVDSVQESTSTQLPPDQDGQDLQDALDALASRTASEGPFDTGSDAWWRAQAAAQRAAAAQEPVVPPPPPAPPAPPAEPPQLVEPTVLLPEPPLPVFKPVAPPPPAPPVQAAAPPTVPAPAPPAAPTLLPEQLVALPPELPAAPLPPPTPAAPLPPPAAPLQPPPPAAPLPPPPAAADAPPLSPLADLPPAPAEYLTQELPPYAPPTAEGDATFYAALQAPEVAAPVGPRRKLLGALVAVAGVGLGVVALFLFNSGEPKGNPVVALPTATQPATAAPTPTVSPSASTLPRATAPPTRPVVAPPAPAAVVPVTVLNNSRVHLLAKRAASRFEAGGWPVAATGNYTGGTVAATTVYYAPGQLASAQRFAKQFGIGRVLPRFAGLPGHGLTVVLARDYAARG